MKEIVQKAAEVIQQGGTILYPTESIWGLGCNALDEAAVEKIFALKNRPAEKSLVLLVADDFQIEQLVQEVPAIAWDLIDTAIKPLTLVLDNAQNLPGIVSAADGSIAVRKTTHPFCQQLIRKIRRPLVSTSANISGAPSPVTFKDVQPTIVNGVDFVVPESVAGKTTNQPSTIIKLGAKGEVKILRD